MNRAHLDDKLKRIGHQDDKLKRIGPQTQAEELLTAKTHVVVYSRPGCHLCEEAKAAIEAVRLAEDFTFEEVNIETDPELLARYRYEIPVIAINGVDRFKYRVDQTEFRHEIRRFNVP